ncbi:MAG: response regulator [Acidobacteriota bacterium]
MRHRVLVVDDEEVVLGAVSTALRHDDLQIETSQSAGEALELLGRHSYDLVITDLMMPGIDGLELLQRIRDARGGTRAIMITGYPTIRTALMAKRLGASEYVTKPFTQQELRSVVVRVLRQAPENTDANERSSTPRATRLTYQIPGHSWLAIDSAKVVTVGMTAQFAASLGVIEGLGMPRVGTVVEQGRVCLTIRAKDGIEHSLHSPASGRVLEVNDAVIRDPGIAEREPEGAGWLLRLQPAYLDRELQRLMPIDPQIP